MTDEKQKTRFNQFIKSIEGINPKTLSIRLKEMKEMGVIEKSFSKWNTYQNRILSYRRKIALQPIVDMMTAYSMKYCSKEIYKKG